MDELNKEEIFEELYKKTSSKAYAIVWQMLRNEQDALDVLQDSYLNAYKKLHTLNDLSKMDAWFCQIAVNKSRDFLKKKKVILFSEIGNDESDSDFEDTIESERKEFIPEESVDYGETKRLMNGILSGLPEEQRMCVLLYYYQELSVEEIASVSECSAGTVKSRLNYARKKIKTEVEKIEKTGTKLYGITPLPFIVWMLREQEASAAELLREKNFVNRIPLRNVKNSMLRENRGESAIKKLGKGASATVKAGGVLRNSMGTKLLIAVTVMGVAGGGAVVGKRVIDKKESQPSSYVEEANESEITAAKSLRKGEKILRAEAYYNYLKECEKRYGTVEVVASNTALGDKLTGLCFAKLLDFDGDGQDEMVLAYEKPSEYNIAPEYNIEIIGFTGEKIKIVFCGHGLRGGQGETVIYLNDKDDPLNYIEGEAKGETEHYQIFQYSDSDTLKKIKEIEIVSVESGEVFVSPLGTETPIFELKYFVDGEEQEEEICRQEVQAWSESQYYQYQTVLFPLTEEMSTAQEELENTWKTLEEILQFNAHETADKTKLELNKEYYGNLLDSYYEAFEQQWNAEEMKAHGLNACFAWENIENISDIGYCFMDLNGNGIDEILIGTKASDGGLFCFEWREYRKKDDFYITAMTTTERRVAYYLKEGALCEVSYWGAGSKSYVYTKTDKGLLDKRFIEELHYDVYEEDNRWMYMNTSSDRNDPFSPISENEAKKVMDSYKNLELDWLPFSEYKKTDKKF